MTVQLSDARKTTYQSLPQRPNCSPRRSNIPVERPAIVSLLYIRPAISCGSSCTDVAMDEAFWSWGLRIGLRGFVRVRQFCFRPLTSFRTTFGFLKKRFYHIKNNFCNYKRVNLTKWTARQNYKISVGLFPQSFFWGGGRYTIFGSSSQPIMV